jgi:hypothetical protein
MPITGQWPALGHCHPKVAPVTEGIAFRKMGRKLFVVRLAGARPGSLASARSRRAARPDALARKAMPLCRHDDSQPTTRVATCNSIASLPPKLCRRFTLGTFFFDLPAVEERETIWRIYLEKYGVSGELPNDEGWTGAESRECCRKAHWLGITLAQASRYIVPVSRSAGEQIKVLRQMASGKFISASTQGVYQYEENSPVPRRRIIQDLGGPVTVMPPSKSEA